MVCIFMNYTFNCDRYLKMFIPGRQLLYSRTVFVAQDNKYPVEWKYKQRLANVKMSTEPSAVDELGDHKQ